MYKARYCDLLDRIEELDESDEAENPLGEDKRKGSRLTFKRRSYRE